MNPTDTIVALATPSGAGAIAVITEPTKDERTAFVGRQKPLKIPVLECHDLSDVLGDVACAFYGHPSQKLTVTAITGTNGKTSVAWLMMHALELLGIKAGYIGTLGVGGIDQLTNLQNTTPSAIAIQKNMAAMVVSGYQHVCVEVSSHCHHYLTFLYVTAAELNRASC